MSHSCLERIEAKISWSVAIYPQLPQTLAQLPQKDAIRQAPSDALAVGHPWLGSQLATTNATCQG